jgi:hypothetical protein
MAFQLNPQIPMSYDYGPTPLEQMGQILTLADLAQQQRIGRQKLAVGAIDLQKQAALKRFFTPGATQVVPGATMGAMGAVAPELAPAELAPAPELAPPTPEEQAQTQFQNPMMQEIYKQALTGTAKEAAPQYSGFSPQQIASGTPQVTVPPPPPPPPTAPAEEKKVTPEEEFDFNRYYDNAFKTYSRMLNDPMLSGYGLDALDKLSQIGERHQRALYYGEKAKTKETTKTKSVIGEYLNVNGYDPEATDAQTRWQSMIPDVSRMTGETIEKLSAMTPAMLRTEQYMDKLKPKAKEITTEQIMSLGKAFSTDVGSYDVVNQHVNNIQTMYDKITELKSKKNISDAAEESPVGQILKPYDKAISISYMRATNPESSRMFNTDQDFMQQILAGGVTNVPKAIIEVLKGGSLSSTSRLSYLNAAKDLKTSWMEATLLPNVKSAVNTALEFGVDPDKIIPSKYGDWAGIVAPTGNEKGLRTAVTVYNDPNASDEDRAKAVEVLTKLGLIK